MYRLTIYAGAVETDPTQLWEILEADKLTPLAGYLRRMYGTRRVLIVGGRYTWRQRSAECTWTWTLEQINVAGEIGALVAGPDALPIGRAGGAYR